MTPNFETKSRSNHFQIKYNQIDIQIFQVYKVWNPSHSTQMDQKTIFIVGSKLQMDPTVNDSFEQNSRYEIHRYKI